MFGISHQSHQDDRFRCLSAQASNGVANLRRRCIFDIAKTHKGNVLGIQAENAGHRQGVCLLNPRTYTCLSSN